MIKQNQKLENYIETKEQEYEVLKNKSRELSDKITSNIQEIKTLQESQCSIEALRIHKIVIICAYITKLDAQMETLIKESIKLEKEIDNLKELL